MTTNMRSCDTSPAHWGDLRNERMVVCLWDVVLGAVELTGHSLHHHSCKLFPAYMHGQMMVTIHLIWGVAVLFTPPRLVEPHTFIYSMHVHMYNLYYCRKWSNLTLLHVRLCPRPHHKRVFITHNQACICICEKSIVHLYWCFLCISYTVCINEVW